MRFALALALLAVLAAGCGRGSEKIPRDFHPEAAASVGPWDYWVLGDYPCSGGWCLAMLRSTDRGGHFARVGFPSLPSQGNVPAVTFANARDGYAFERGSRLYVTHDGGASWRPSGPSGVSNLAVGGRNVYVAFSRNRVERSSLAASDWRALALPVSLHQLVSLSARGRSVWLLGSTSDLRAGDVALRSGDRGSTWASNRAPCFADLGGTLVPMGRGTVWAVCPTGMMAGLWLSTDGGRSFPAVRSFHDPGGVGYPPMTNGAAIFPITASRAILSGGAQGVLYRTSDRGGHWTRLNETPRFGDIWWLKVARNGAGSALAATQRPNARTLLWRTANGGKAWKSIPISQ